jgi:hypothetical protein
MFFRLANARHIGENKGGTGGRDGKEGEGGKGRGGEKEKGGEAGELAPQTENANSAYVYSELQ